MRSVRILSAVYPRLEVTGPGPDAIPVYQVVGTWMRDCGVQYGDEIQTVSAEIDGMDAPVWVWIVIARSGRVQCIADPPVGFVTPIGPLSVYFQSK